MAPYNRLPDLLTAPYSAVAIRLNAAGIIWLSLLASSWKRYFDALVASSVFAVCCELTSSPAGQDYCPAYAFFLFYALFILVLTIFQHDWQKRRHEYLRSEEWQRYQERKRRLAFQRWRELPRWDDNRYLSPWYRLWKQKRREEAQVRQRVTLLWVRQHVVTFSRDQEQDRLWERARVYARHAYQAPSWTVRATQAMLKIRRSPPRLISIPRQSCAAQDSQESRPDQPSRLSVQQTPNTSNTAQDSQESRPDQASRLSVQQTPDTNNTDSQGSTSRSTEPLNPPRAAAKKQSLFDLLRSENFSDSLLGCRRVQHRRI